MINLTGKYAKDCVIFSDDVENGIIPQVMSVLNHEAFEDCKIRIQPDNHVGTGCVIGFTSSKPKFYIPNLIGVDIGCGVSSFSFDYHGSNVDLTCEIDYTIRTNVPHGFGTHKVGFPLSDNEEMICKIVGHDPHYASKSIGTLGGGNHFIEVGVLENGKYLLTIHSGSRKFGLDIANYYQDKAYSYHKQYGKDLAHLNEIDSHDYFYAVCVAQEYAHKNRAKIAEIIFKSLGLNYESYVESVHNYIDPVDGTIRKGAISAHKNEDVIIPWNMRDGLIIGRGKGNPEWNLSAPHGAGRILSRSQAKKVLDLEVFKKQMDGIYTSSVGVSTLDEAPDAYKDHRIVEKYLHETLDIVERVKPIHNFKASEKK